MSLDEIMAKRGYYWAGMNYVRVTDDPVLTPDSNTLFSITEEAKERNQYNETIRAAFGDKDGPDDPINPSYYKLKCGVEVIDIIGDFPYLRASALKYMLRAGNKAGNSEKQDLEKAMFFLKREIESIK